MHEYEEYHQYEEYHECSAPRSWAFILLLSGGLIGWCMSMMVLLKDVPREWDFGNIEFTPGKSIYSTHHPENTTRENMIHPLPGAVSPDQSTNSKNDRP